jgi:hypothetical protein
MTLFPAACTSNRPWQKISQRPALTVSQNNFVTIQANFPCRKVSSNGESAYFFVTA